MESRDIRNTASLCKFIEEKLGYKGNQLLFDNGAALTTLSDFIDDNPGVLEVIVDWMEDNYADELDCDEDEDE
jgi:hypothetical protein